MVWPWGWPIGMPYPYMGAAPGYMFCGCMAIMGWPLTIIMGCCCGMPCMGMPGCPIIMLAGYGDGCDAYCAPGACPAGACRESACV